MLTMNPLCSSAEIPPKKYILFDFHPTLRTRNARLRLPHSLFCSDLRRPPVLKHPSLNLSQTQQPRSVTTSAADSASAAAATSEIDMERNEAGVYAPRRAKVVILWDLDNKPPHGPPYPAAMSLRLFSEKFGDIVNMSAYANRHAFIHLPDWVVDERRERRRIDSLERRGAVAPPEPYVCGVCGRKCRTHVDLRKHFKQLHQRERQKKVNRMNSLKGKKRRRFRERFITGNHKYEEAARDLVRPRAGYGLESELRRAGVFVKTVEDKPQAADWALKRQIEHSMSSGVEWLLLVSDDSDFRAMLGRAREANVGTVVVGDRGRALGRHADYWVPWDGVQNGVVTESDLVPGSCRWSESTGRNGDTFSTTHFDDGTVMDELVAMRPGIGDLKVSVFSDGEEEEEKFDDDTITGVSLWNSEDEEPWEQDGDIFI